MGLVAFFLLLKWGTCNESGDGFQAISFFCDLHVKEEATFGLIFKVCPCEKELG